MHPHKPSSVGSIRYALVATPSFLADQVQDALSRLGCDHDPHAPFVVVLDVPRGSAHQALFAEQRPMLVLTDGSSPEYLLDLADARQVTGVLPARNLQAVATFLHHRAAGDLIGSPRLPHSVLTVTERNILRGVAYGWENDAIARSLGLREKYVRNRLTVIFRTLMVADRTEALMYYWGLPPASSLTFPPVLV